MSLFVGVLLACGVRQDEFDCENAVAHLAECCPGFSPSSIECTYSSYCTTTYPEIDIADSDCIRGESCEDLIGTGVCGRVQELPANSAPTYMVTSSPVCGPGAAPYVPPAAQHGGGGVAEDAGLSIGCLSASDCAEGEACCADPSTTSSACGFAPCASGFQLCATSAECARELACIPLVSGIAITVCAKETDVGPDAASDGAGDASAQGADGADEPSRDDGGGGADGGGDGE